MYDFAFLAGCYYMLSSNQQKSLLVISYKIGASRKRNAVNWEKMAAPAAALTEPTCGTVRDRDGEKERLLWFSDRRFYVHRSRLAHLTLSFVNAYLEVKIVDCPEEQRARPLIPPWQGSVPGLSKSLQQRPPWQVKRDADANSHMISQAKGARKNGDTGKQGP